MFNKIKKGLKEVKRYMDKKIQAGKEILNDRENRFALGVIVTSLGVGLMISACVHITA